MIIRGRNRRVGLKMLWSEIGQTVTSTLTGALFLGAKYSTTEPIGITKYQRKAKMCFLLTMFGCYTESGEEFCQ